ncbi:hypothetical protein [Azospirillum endophyticum]
MTANPLSPDGRHLSVIDAMAPPRYPNRQWIANQAVNC